MKILKVVFRIDEDFIYWQSGTFVVNQLVMVL
jgi:hypothetical protein